MKCMNIFTSHLHSIPITLKLMCACLVCLIAPPTATAGNAADTHRRGLRTGAIRFQTAVHPSDPSSDSGSVRSKTVDKALTTKEEGESESTSIKVLLLVVVILVIAITMSVPRKEKGHVIRDVLVELVAAALLLLILAACRLI